jgi:hypothetical protein
MSADKVFHEPKYVSFIMHCIVGHGARDVILGDMFEHYRRIHGETGRLDADSWLRDEVGETLLKLVWRRDFVSYMLRSLRKLAGFDFLRRASGVCYTKTANSLLVTNAFSYQLNARIAFAGLILFSVVGLIFFNRSRHLMTQVTNDVQRPASPQLIAQNRGAPTVSAETLEGKDPPAVDTPRQKPKKEIHKLATPSAATTSTAEIMLTGEITRDLSKKGIITIPRSGTRALSLKLPAGSESGVYDMTLRDARETVVYRSTVRSVDGKKIVVGSSAQKFLQKLPDSGNYFSLSERSNKNGPPINFQFVLTPK